MPTQPSYWKVLTRRKVLNNETGEEVKLNRVLGLFDLTALGIGSTLGAGVYVLAGQIAKDQAGPSVMISFAIAALASALAGVCYAEFGARVPKAGSAYIYSYVCIGEFIAFVIGWNLILEYVIGTAGVCRSISLYLDTLLDDTLKTYFAQVAPIQWNFFGGYFDFLAFTLAVVFGVTTAFGVETSTMLNNFCTILNILVLLFVIIAGSIKADISNWQVDPSTNFTGTNYNIGEGGYFPFGFEGTLKGAATCFFGFVGFDCIATTGEEVRNPQKNIPRSIFYSLLVIFLCYLGVSTVLTLMVPYYAQDPNAPLPYAFKEVGWTFGMWIVTIGGLIGLLASLFGALFPIPRIIYSMAEDGLLFRFLGKVNPRFKTPVTGSIFAAFLTGIISGTFDLAQLVNLLSIGTLLAYTVVAISVTILRFMTSNEEAKNYHTDCHLTENTMLTSNGTKITFKIVLLQIFNYQRVSTPNYLSTKIVGALILFFCIISLSCALLIKNAGEAIMNHESWALAVLITFIVLIVILLTAIWIQPREFHTSIFRVPLVPLVPAISIFINIYLMLQLDAMTWIRFGVWMVIGLPVIIICYCTFDKSKNLIKNRRQLFMDTLHNCNLIFNGQLEVIENGICNNSIKILVSQPSNEENKQTENKKESYKSSTDQNKEDNLVYYNSSLIENQLTRIQEKAKEECFKKVTIEEENSVIAMLDDVLENEDDGIITPDYIQQISSTSESTSSFVKTTTKAMIHNDYAPILNESEKSNQACNKLQENTNLYIEVWQLAFNLVDEILRSDKLVLTVKAKKISRDKPHDAVHFFGNSGLKCSKRNSESFDQHSLDEDPLHSDNFKNKLSLLICQAPTLNRVKKNENQSLPKPELSPELKLSKSEADIRKMILRTIEVTENTWNSEKGPLNIPTAPKFDPVLYRTIGNTSIRTRPNLDKLIPSKPTKMTALELLEEEIPFRLKLEAILQRGPSHRIQNRSDFITTQKPRVGNLDFSGNLVQQNVLFSPPVLNNKTSSLRPTKHLKATSKNVETINDIRKKLRHVSVDKKK